MPQATDLEQKTLPPARRGQGPLGGPMSSRRAGSYERDSCRLARSMVSVAFGVTAEEIARPKRSDAKTCKVRHSAMYLAHVAFQVPLTAVAEDFGRDRTGVAYAIRRVEERRDARDFDAQIGRLEQLAAAFRRMIDGMGYSAGADRG